MRYPKQFMELNTFDDEMEVDDGKFNMVQRIKKKIAGMTRIRRGLTVDSGAADHVIPVAWIIGMIVMMSIGQIRGLMYVAANGSKIANCGQTVVEFMSGEGTWAKLIFQIAAINKPLVSVAKLVEDGYRVVFDEEESHIIHKKTKQVIIVRKERGVFVIDAYVNSKKKSNNEPGFNRPGR